MIEVVLEEELLYFLELVFQVMKLFIIVFFNRGNLLSYVRQLPYLVLHLVLEKADLVLKIFDAQLIEHDYIVISVLTQEALEAYRTQVVLAECLDLLGRMYLAPTLLKLSNLIVTHFCISLSIFLSVE